MVSDAIDFNKSGLQHIKGHEKLRKLTILPCLESLWPFERFGGKSTFSFLIAIFAGGSWKVMLMYAVRLRIVNSQHRKKVGTRLASMFLLAVAQNLMGSSCAKAKCNLPPREIAAFKAIIKTASFYVLGCNFTNQSFKHYHLTRFQFLQFFKRLLLRTTHDFWCWG